MAYRVIRMKKEARRNTKLDEIFQVTGSCAQNFILCEVDVDLIVRKKTEPTEA